MSDIILVTGGARSGKSTFAEKLTEELASEVLYIATAIPFDDEMQCRIKKHKESRNKDWITHEGYKDLDNVFSKYEFQCILLDCMTIMISNLLMDKVGENIDAFSEEAIDKIEKEIIEEISSFLDAAESNEKSIVLVTNEVGYGIVPEYKLGRVFRDISGRVNQYMAKRAATVYLTVSGIPLKIK